MPDTKPFVHAASVAVLAMAVLLLSGGWAAAEEADATLSQKSSQPFTLVIFADRKMGDSEYAELFDALRRNLPEAGAQAQSIPANPRIVRGDEISASGLPVESAIVVYLHGNCTLAPLLRRTAYGVPLGWVRADHGRIEPFVHVDCTAIGQVLGQQALGLDEDRRNATMAGAMARVILHEWIHIATQNPGHAPRGIEKAAFGVSDLTAGDRQPGASQRGQE